MSYDPDAFRSLLVIGHSHVLTLRAAAVRRREAHPQHPRARTLHLLDAAFGGELADEGGGDAFSAGVRGAIQDQIGRHRPFVASVVGGNAHVVTSLLQPGRRFDFALPNAPGEPEGLEQLPLDPAADIIGEADARAMLRLPLECELTRLHLLRELIGPFHHIQAPPPVRRTDWLYARAESFFRDQLHFSEAAIAPPGVRYRTWRLASRMVAEECAAIGCGYMIVPREACGAAGMLRPSLASDATHGNPHFGEVMLRELDRVAAAQEEGSA